MECYKVVLKDYRGIYVSLTVAEHRLEYPIGEIVRPKFGLIFVFQNLDDAIYYAGTTTRLKIFKCECDSLERLYVCSDWCVEECFEDFWKNRDEKDRDYIMNSPRGTYGCNKLKMLEEVLL